MKKQLETLKKQAAQSNHKFLIIGLGNPGEKYRETRHNAGFAVIDSIADKHKVKFRKLFLKPVLIGYVSVDNTDYFLVKPLTYMNRSGEIITAVMRKTGTSVENMILICDNMDLKPGIIRLKKNGSSAGHNGIKSVIEHLGTSDFARMYIGVDRPAGGESVVEHVLSGFDLSERKDYDAAVSGAADALVSLKDNTLIQVMNEINKKNN